MKNKIIYVDFKHKSKGSKIKRFLSIFIKITRKILHIPKKNSKPIDKLNKHYKNYL